MTQPLPVYIPTPKHILEARKANGTATNDEEGGGVNANGAASNLECPPASKRPRLEYVPKAIKINQNPILTYIPSALSRSTSIGSDDADAANELEYEPSNIVDKTNRNGTDTTGLFADLSSDQITQNGQISGDNTENGSLTTMKTVTESNVSNELSAPATNDDSKSKENRHRSSSSSSSSRHHRHHSSSSSSNHKSSHSDRKGSSSSSRSSSSSHRSSRHHHHSSSRKSKHSDKDSDKDKDDGKVKTDSKHSDSRSSKSSSSSRHHHRSSNQSNKKTHSNNNHSSSSDKQQKQEDCPSNSVDYDMEFDDDDDDDVEAQCRMIFEEFEPQTAEENQPSDDMLSLELQAAATYNHDSGIDTTSTSTMQDDATKKKRIAHENADKQVKPIATFKRNSDHVKNAMQVI